MDRFEDIRDGIRALCAEFPAEYHRNIDRDRGYPDAFVEALTRDIIASQRRRIFLREALARGRLHDWDYHPADELEQHCLRADKVYSNWAYQDIVDYRFPEE